MSAHPEEPAAKRLKAQSQLLKNRATAIFNALTAPSLQSLTAGNCSDPDQLHRLPYPVPELQIGALERFPLDSEDRFLYMGRRQFAKIWKEVETTRFNEITVFGSEGYGKSFILAALVCCLIRDTAVFRGKARDARAGAAAGESTVVGVPSSYGNHSRNGGRLPRVVYIPNCDMLLSSFAMTLQAAFILAYADDDRAMVAIADLETTTAFSNWVGLRGTTDEFIFVLDQHNALDSTPESDLKSRANKHDIASFLQNLRLRHLSILGASPNSPLATKPQSTHKQSGFSRFDLFGGLVPVDNLTDLTEWNAWRRHFGEQLPEMDQQEETTMQFLTGLVPLYLHAVVAATRIAKADVKQRVIETARKDAEETAAENGGDQKDIEQAGQDAAEAAAQLDYKPMFTDVWPNAALETMRDQRNNISDFSSGIQCNPLQRWNDYTKFIDAALVGGTVPPIGVRDLYDHRYFFVSPQNRAHCLSGNIAEAAAQDLTSKSSGHFLTRARDQLHLAAQANPSIQGFLVEQVVIAAINKFGLEVSLPHSNGKGKKPAVNKKVLIVPQELRTFSTPTDYAIEHQAEIVLWVPNKFNYTAVDAVLRIRPLLQDDKKPKVPARFSCLFCMRQPD